MEQRLHNFVLNPSGKLVWIENMPEEPKHDVKCHSQSACICASLAFESGANRDVVDGYDDNCPHRYKAALQSAIDSAVEVSNQKDVLIALARQNEWDDWYRSEDGVLGYMTEGGTYTLLCSVEKDELRRYKSKILNKVVWSQWYKTEPTWVDGHDFESKTVALVTLPDTPSPVEKPWPIIGAFEYDMKAGTETYFSNVEPCVCLDPLPDTGNTYCTRCRKSFAMRKVSPVERMEHNDYSIEAHRRELFKQWSEGGSVKTWEAFLISTIANAVDKIQELEAKPPVEKEETQEQFTKSQVVKILEAYADHVYKGYYVHKQDVEDILETLEPLKVIDEFLTRK